jgi:ribosomal protein S18 acetylase RimI-like enzyme
MGYVTINIKEKINPIMQYKKWLVIDAICINKEDRGKGIGTALLNYVKKIGKEKKCTDIYLTVNEENKNAIRFYEKFGLRVKNISYSMPI